MKHQLLSELDLLLADRFEYIFRPPGDLIDFAKDDAGKAYEKYTAVLPSIGFDNVYSGIYDVFCGRYSMVGELTSGGISKGFDRDYNNLEYLKMISRKTKQELSSPSVLQNVFSIMYAIRRRRLETQAAEQETLGMLPVEARKCWNDISFAEDAKFMRDENGSCSVVTFFEWGKLELELTEPICEPAAETAVELNLEHRELYSVQDGYGLSFRYFCYDKHGTETVAPREYEVTFKSMEYRCELYDYCSYCETMGFPVAAADLLLVNRLSRILVEKQHILGDAALNDTENWLFPAAQIFRELQVTQTYQSAEMFLALVSASPEQLDSWAEILKNDAGDKYLHKAFSAIARQKEQPTMKNTVAAWKKLQNANLELMTFHGRPVIKWILANYKKACGGYAKKPPIVKSLESLGAELRDFITTRLSSDGFSGEYPHFRRITKPNAGEFISFMEISYIRPDSLYAMAIAGTLRLDATGGVQGIPFEALTAYDCQYAGGKDKARYTLVCGMENPAFNINDLNVRNAGAKTIGMAKEYFELHLEQVYLVLSGKRVAREYKRRHGIKNGFGGVSWVLAKICFLTGLGWSTAFWLLFSIFISFDTGAAYLDVITDIETIVICYAGGMLAALALWLFLAAVMRKSNGAR